MKYIVDTNILLNDIDLSNCDGVVVPIVVLEELDRFNHSSDFEKAYKARRAFQMLQKLIDTDRLFSVNDNEIEIDFPKFLSTNNADNIILAHAMHVQKIDNEYLLATLDRAMYQKAILCGIKCELVEILGNSIYKGYSFYEGTSEEINNQFLENQSNKLNINEYVVIHNTSDNTTKEMKWNGSEFVKLKLPSSNFIKAKNSLQRCALDMLFDDSITTCCILGGYGSGKSFLSMQMALYLMETDRKRNFEKILGIREPNAEGKDIGFLKGTFQDKTGPFFKPLEQQMEDYKFESLLKSGKLETQIPKYMKGTTYNNTIILVDEAEDLTESQIRLIGTRVGENSKICFSGDYNQSLINKTLHNPLVKLCNELKGEKSFACIYLDEDVRSETSKMFSTVFKK